PAEGHRSDGDLGDDGEGRGNDARHRPAPHRLLAHCESRPHRTRTPLGVLLQGGEVQVKTKNLVVVALAVIMISAVWYRMVYSPIKSKPSKANAAANNAEIDAKNLQDAIDNIMAANKKSAAKDVGTAQMLVAVPADSAEASFLRSLDTVRVGSGAAWQSV